MTDAKIAVPEIPPGASGTYVDDPYNLAQCPMCGAPLVDLWSGVICTSQTCDWWF